MQFQYLAKDRHGKSIDGQFEGESALAVRQKLRSQGLFALSVEPLKSRSKSAPIRERQNPSVKSRSPYRSFASQRVKGADLIVVLSQLSIMCQSGDDLAEALHTVAIQCSSAPLQRVLLATHEDVTQGL
jgi:type II secretory pathway component PulF